MSAFYAHQSHETSSHFWCFFFFLHIKAHLQSVIPDIVNTFYKTIIRTKAEQRCTWGGGASGDRTIYYFYFLVINVASNYWFIKYWHHIIFWVVERDFQSVSWMYVAKLKGSNEFIVWNNIFFKRLVANCFTD